MVLGTPSANRNRKEIEPLIGFFVNTLALRTNLSGNPTIADFLSNVKETTLNAYSHQDLPFEYIVDAINPERNLSHSPIFQVMFVHQTSKDRSTKQGGNLSIMPIESHNRTAKFDLTLFMVESNDEVGGAFEFNTDLFLRKTIEKFISYFRTILKTFLDDTATKVDQISLLDKIEQERL
ncbi:MAG: non-ribosomal peptide synthetase, partial [Ignavibacteriae bacterium]|nr:non-ribosomal peptide synthetase [Ignavibacteriota bacterium]